jgi:hypothetical protein
MKDSYHHLLSAIYDLVLAPTDWPIVLRLLAEALNSPCAASVITTPERDTPRSLGVVGITPDDHCAFLHTWHKRNVFGVRQPPREAGAIVLGRTILPKSALLRTAMYRDYLAPGGIEEVLRLDIFSDACRIHSISLGRPWASGPFTTDELAFAPALMPHLQRVATLHAHVEGTTSIARTAIDVLDGAQAPLLLLDATGQVVHASADADRLLHEADGLSAGRDGLRAATPALSAQLRAVLARAAGSSRSPGVSGALHLRRPSGKPDLVLVAIPARSRSLGPDIGRASIVLHTRTRSPARRRIRPSSPTHSISRGRRRSWPPIYCADRALSRRRKSEGVAWRRCALISRASLPKPGLLDRANSFASSRASPAGRGR